MRLLFPIGILSLGLAASCKATKPEHLATTAVVDSTVPRDEALRRFRVGLDSVSRLSEGAGSREELVKRFVAAVEKTDTAELRRLTITKREFGWIYYPTNPQGLPPYDLAPALLWFMIETRGRTGLGKLLQERGGNPLHYLRTECDSTPSVEGDNRIWGPCAIVRRQERGDELAERLFGPIIERDGRFKFVNYANKID